jgi:hypothetical protein
MSAPIDRAAFTAIIDAAINEFRERKLVSATEICDVLLDLRLTVLDPASSVNPVAELVAAMPASR